ncbi:MAG: aminopeptidase [Flavobacteriaceae bacterium]|nr:aminopeptidase [Flavobacteriaceae bacterium]
MKRLHLCYALLFTLGFFNCKSAQKTTALAPVSEVSKVISNYEKLSSIKNVAQIIKKNPVDHFDENYEIWFEQPIDHEDPSKGTFMQRVLLGFKQPESPVIVELQGYGIYTDQSGELAKHYEANQLTIEHRYFKNSRPEHIDWNTLTIKNAANDQALIIDAIRDALFPNAKFVTTGISKGCQTTMAHRRFFPNNVDASVCYVGPLNYQREDPRVYSFLNHVGTTEDRAKVKAFQELCFENRAALLDLMKQEAKTKNFTWEFGIDKAIDYTILEYAFAFWQWGVPPESIPFGDISPEDIYKHLIKVVGYSFFEDRSVSDLQPYFWAALTEQGIYGYETAPFKKYLNTDKIYTFDWAFPEGISKTYDLKPMQKIRAFLNTTAEKILFIYGEYDAWSATAVVLENNPKQREMYKYIHPKGDHKTRISSFNSKTQTEIYSIIDSWIFN